VRTITRWIGLSLLLVGAWGLTPAVLSRALLPAQTIGGTVDHSAYDALLKAHVVNGRVDYDAFERDPAFARYLASLNRVDEGRLGEDERLAFWINVYNAYTIALVNKHHERQSIRNINRSLGVLRLKGPWNEPIVRAAGRTMTLDEVEHRVLREQFHEPRIHFALVSASVGSPPLRSEAYTGEKLVDQFWEQGKVFLRESPEKNSFEKRRFRASPIFTFYRSDFGSSRTDIGSFLAPWFEGDVKARLEKGEFFLMDTKFDWGLNGVGGAGRAATASSTAK